MPNYAVHVPSERNPKAIAVATVVVGFAAIFASFCLFAQYVSSDVGVSGTFILVLVVGGFVAALIGLVMWCRQSTGTHRRIMSRSLLVTGAVTFCLASLGHVFGTLVAVAIPALLLGVVVRFLPVRTTGG